MDKEEFISEAKLQSIYGGICLSQAILSILHNEAIALSLIWLFPFVFTALNFGFACAIIKKEFLNQRFNALGTLRFGLFLTIFISGLCRYAVTTPEQGKYLWLLIGFLMLPIVLGGYHSQCWSAHSLSSIDRKIINILREKGIAKSKYKLAKDELLGCVSLKNDSLQKLLFWTGSLLLGCLIGLFSDNLWNEIVNR